MSSYGLPFMHSIDSISVSSLDYVTTCHSNSYTQVYHSEAVGLPVGETIHIKYFGNDPVTGEERWSRRALLTAGKSYHFCVLKRRINGCVKRYSIMQS